MTYKILRAESYEQLEQIVNEHIKQGFKPQGGLMISAIDIHRFKFYFQAMVKV